MTGPHGVTTLLVIAKEPVPGRVKTRLTPPYSPRQAAALAEASLADTLDAVLRAPARRRVLVLDGAPGAWLPPGFDVVPQVSGGLDERLAAAFAGCTGPTLLVGMDTPQLTPALLEPTLRPDAWLGCDALGGDALGHDALGGDALGGDALGCDAWFGPAEDGGFWALGLAEPDPSLLLGVPMSTDLTGRIQRRRLTDAGLRVRDLPRLRDVDTAADAAEVAALAPGSRFAAALRATGLPPTSTRVPEPAGGLAAGRTAAR